MTRALGVGCLVLLICAGCDEESPAPVDAGLDAAGGAEDGGACACDDGLFCNGAERCEGDSCAAGSAPCEAGESCDEDSDACVPSDCAEPDADGDGANSIECGGADCDDTDANRYPGAVEVCDPMDRDEDCDPRTFGVRDADGDGYADMLCCNGEGDARVCGDDCNDTRSAEFPGGVEACDQSDNDCDGIIDEGVFLLWYEDGDGDSFGDPEGATMMNCARPEGYASNADDCDDDDQARNPGNGEDCAPPAGGSPIDEDCDLIIDEMCGCVAGMSRSCAAAGAMGRCATGIQNCVAGTWGGCSITPSTEVCNSEDDNCNGMTDEFTVSCYADGDGDGVARERSGTVMCHTEGAPSCPSGFTRTRPPVVDCNDGDASIYPGNTERCDGVDNNCDGIDADFPGGPVLAEDADGDRTTSPDYTRCTGGHFGHFDCDDTNGDVSPRHGDWETMPYCPGAPATTPVNCGGTWRCGGCGGTLASWDWDCLDGVTPQTVECTVCAHADCQFRNSGPVLGSVSASDCGTMAPTINCGTAPTCSGSCESEAAGSAIVRCH